MNIDQKIQRLYELGHFFNPKVDGGRNITPDKLSLLTFNDEVVREALRSFQDMMVLDFERLSFKHHNRGALFEGELDPATLELFEIPRCSYPDYSLPGKIGNGSWPEPCQKAGVTFSFDPANMPSKYKDTFEKNILDFAIRKYAKIGLKLVRHTGSGQANIRIYFKSFFGSTIGMAEFNSESCSDSVFCSISSSFSPNEPTEADLLVHELGHNMNLQHTRGGTMNPSIINQTEFLDWLPSDPSYNTLVRYFGGEPVDVIPPIPSPTVPKVVLVSYLPNIDIIEVDMKNKELRTKSKGILTDTYSLLSNRII